TRPSRSSRRPPLPRPARNHNDRLFDRQARRLCRGDLPRGLSRRDRRHRRTADYRHRRCDPGWPPRARGGDRPGLGRRGLGRPGCPSRQAGFGGETTREDFADGIEGTGVRLAVDTVGVLLGGRPGGAGENILRYADAVCGDPGGRTNWLGMPASAPPELVALVSSTLGHALDFDDELAGTGHPASILTSAMLALPVRPLSGARLIEACAIGYEANVRVA